jgi:hypothetical protein
MQTKEITTMTKQSSPLTPVLAAALAAALLALAGCGAAPVAPAAPRVPQSQSVAEADRKLAQAASERAQAGAQFAESEQACYTKFLVNRCIDEAREKRRATLAQVRAVEVEAERFKRQSALEARDREIAESEKKFEADNARMVAERAARPEPVEPAPKPVVAPVNRAAERAAKVKKQEAQDQAGAPKRAANAAAFEKRKRESEQRQREIEEKKKAKVSKGEAE